jgi:hypothetical protein
VPVLNIFRTWTVDLLLLDELKLENGELYASEQRIFKRM